MHSKSVHDFGRDAFGALREALVAPLFVLDRGQPSHVLVSIAQYQALLSSNASIVDLLGMPGIEDVPFELANPHKERPADSLKHEERQRSPE